MKGVAYWQTAAMIDLYGDDIFVAGGEDSYGSTGYMYNIHRPIDPDTGNSTETQVGFIDGLTTYDNL